MILSLGVFLMVSLLASLTYAASSKLFFTNVDVKIAAKTLRNLSNTAAISEEARPGRTVEFRVEVRNNFTNAQDVTIRDITTKVTIEGIDDGNDLEKESDTFDLRADTERKTIHKFDIPLEVEQDTFNVIIESEGQDDNNVIHRDEIKLKLDVAKDNHLLKIIQKKLSPAEISCSRKNVQLALTILNMGKDDEDGISVQISNKDLGIDIQDKIGSLRARPNQPESMFSKTYTLKIPDNAEAGNYPINIKVLYDLDRKVADETATLTVSDCKKPVIVPSEKPKEETGGVELIMSSLGKAISTVTEPIPAGTVVTQESILSSNSFLAAVMIAVFVAMIIIIVLLVTLFIRKG